MGNVPNLKRVHAEEEQNSQGELALKLRKVFAQHETMTLETVLHLLQTHLDRKATSEDYTIVSEFSHKERISQEQALSFPQFQQLICKLCFSEQKQLSFKKNAMNLLALHHCLLFFLFLADQIFYRPYVNQ